MAGITTHVLDTARGLPARGVPVRLERMNTGGAFELVGDGVTDADGRHRALVATEAVTAATYRISFDTAAYAKASATPCFFPEVSIVFVVIDVAQHFHVPLLLSPFGYSTYRGS
ncbi:hydroxyisourate hydrolase [soil metagenome]